MMACGDVRLPACSALCWVFVDDEWIVCQQEEEFVSSASAIPGHLCQATKASGVDSLHKYVNMLD